MKVLKFGGKSLANGKGLETVLSIITEKVAQGQEIAVVVSARDKATDQLESMLERAARGEDISADFQAFKQYQIAGEDIDCGIFYITTYLRWGLSFGRLQ